MSKPSVIKASLAIFACGLVYWLFVLPEVADAVIPDSAEAIQRGRYLVDAGGCVSCHEGVDDPQSLSGGLALESDFGTFYVSNITPDPVTGIGDWSGKDLLLALKHGRRPGGGFYYPAFPYLSYADLADRDVLDIGAYLMSLPAVEFSPPDHEIPGWLWRWTLAGWNKLAQSPPRAVATEFVRGAYLARSLGHCGECHTPRNLLGMPDFDREFAGVMGEKKIEAIDAQALAEWTEEDLGFFLFLGVKPDGEFVGGEMEKVIEHNTSKLSAEDRQALAAFLKRS